MESYQTFLAFLLLFSFLFLFFGQEYARSPLGHALLFFLFGFTEGDQPQLTRSKQEKNAAQRVSRCRKERKKNTIESASADRLQTNRVFFLFS